MHVDSLGSPPIVRLTQREQNALTNSMLVVGTLSTATSGEAQQYARQAALGLLGLANVIDDGKIAIERPDPEAVREAAGSVT